MKLGRRFGASWGRLGRGNAFGAILTKDGNIADWTADEFWTTGRVDAERFMTELSGLVPEAPRTRALDFRLRRRSPEPVPPSRPRVPAAII